MYKFDAWTIAFIIIIDIVRVFAYNIYNTIKDYGKGFTMNQKYLSLKETSSKWGISCRRINTLCLENRIPGAFKVGNSWAIPEDACKPNDERIKSGKYIVSEKKNVFK